MKTRDKILCSDLPPPLTRALGEGFGAQAEILTTPAAGDADLLLYPSGGALPAALSPALPRLGIDISRPQRLGSLLRRCRQMLDSPAFYIDDLHIGDALFQPQEKNIAAPGGAAATLTDKEVDILVRLARHAGRTLRREDLLHRVWRYQSGVDTHTLETHVYRLRQKLAALGGLENLLETDEDGGYRISAPVVAAAPAAEAED